MNNKFKLFLESVKHIEPQTISTITSAYSLIFEDQTQQNNNNNEKQHPMQQGNQQQQQQAPQQQVQAQPTPQQTQPQQQATVNTNTQTPAPQPQANTQQTQNQVITPEQEQAQTNEQPVNEEINQQAKPLNDTMAKILKKNIASNVNKMAINTANNYLQTVQQTISNMKLDPAFAQQMQNVQPSVDALTQEVTSLFNSHFMTSLNNARNAVGQPQPKTN